MTRKTTEQWLALFEQHKISGLIQTQFAKQHGINPTTFSYRKRQLLAWQQDENTRFVELTPQGVSLGQPVVLERHDVELHLLPGTDALWLAILLKATS